MKRFFALVATVAMVGCGSEAANPGESDDGDRTPAAPVWGGPVGNVSLPAISDASAARVLITGTRDGAVYFQYLTQFVPTAQFTIPLPLTAAANESYTVEVITATPAEDESRNPFQAIQEYWKATDIRILGEQTEPLVLDLVKQVTPTLAVSDIYLGLYDDAPYNRYTVTAETGAAFPWARAWSVKCVNCGTGYEVPLKYTLNAATFPVPVAPSPQGTFNFEAALKLDRAFIKDANEVPWVFTTRTSKDPVNMRDVVINPADVP